MDTVLKKIGNMGLVPVVVMDDAARAADTAKALMDGGLDTMEITLRTDQGIAAIKKVKEAYPDMLVGAGTVLSVDKAKEAVDAGAQYIVSPGFNPKLVQWCIDQGIAITPGCVTPTEIEQALGYGLNTLKFFPANLYGGINGCKALHGPYRMVSFIPTGGISLQTLPDFADKPYVHAIGGGWLCKAADINAGRYDTIAQVVKQSIDTLLGFELAHVGINAAHAEASLGVAGLFAEGFGFTVKQGHSSNFAGTGIEVMKSAGKGDMGHLAIKTNSIDRAVYYLGKRGYAVDPSTIKMKNDKTVAVYLKNDFGGFAVHLLQK